MQNKDIKQPTIINSMHYQRCGLMQNKDIKQQSTGINVVLRSCGLMQNKDIKQQDAYKKIDDIVVV